MFEKKATAKIIAALITLVMILGVLPVITGAKSTSEMKPGDVMTQARAADAETPAYSLPSPKTNGGISVEKALQNRRSQRQYQDKAITVNQLSQILWAAYGMTAPGRRTSPSAGAVYPLEIYVVAGDVEGLASGVYKYLAEEHQLELIVAGDVRNEYLAYAAPATLLYSADFEKAIELYGEQDIRYLYMEAGHSAQNVYLQAESLGLGTCAVAGFIEGYIREIFQLPANEGPIYLMPIGYIKGNAAAQDAPQTAAGLSLPPPQTDGGVSVERALHKRRSQRQYQETAISANQLSQILWAAYGMTAPGRRTSPSAGALYALEIYVVVGDVVGIAPGVYKYIPEEHQLELIVAGDVRNEYLGYAAPATLLYCADFEKALESYGEQDLKYVYMEAGHSAQNVYLQAESLGLCTCAVGGFIEGYLREIFRLPANEGPIYLMPIGYAKNFALDPPFVYEAKDLPPRVSFDVYLCIGQSNMAGDDAILEEQDKHVIPNTLLFNGENWESAQPWYYKNIETRGLNRYNNVDTEFIGNGSFLNPAFYFAHHMQAAAPGRTIGIISNARSWSSIDEWRKGEFCYNQTVLMTKAALQQGGILRGILWHQGESDLWLDILPPYLSKLNQVVDDLRSEFGLLPENCPFIAGEIGYAFGAGLGFLPPSAFNDLLPGFVNAARNTDYVSAALDPAYPANGGLPMFNEFHFNTASQRVLGMRYAEKMLKMQGGGLPSGLTVSGLVKSYNPQHPVNLKLQGENIFYTHTIYKEESGSGLREQPFAFEGVEPGTYTLLITKDAHTSFTVRNIVVADKDVDLTQDARPEVRLMTLRCGDINGDGNINNSDLTILWQQANYNRSASAAANKLCDLNGDGLINNIDLTILWLGYNYNRGEIEIK